MSNLRVDTLEAFGSGGILEVGKLGYTFEYAADVLISSHSQIIKDGDVLYRVSGSTSLPYTTTGLGMPEGGAFVGVGDGLLRSELLKPSGVNLVGGAIRFASSIAELDSLTDLVEGQHINALGTTFVWEDSAFKPKSNINAALFGIKPESPNNFQALKDAVAWLAGPAVIEFEDGVYDCSSGSPSEIANWLIISKSGLEFKSKNKWGAKLVNLKCFIKGDAGPMLNLSEKVDAGDHEVSVTTNHSLIKGDYFQLFGTINAYTADAGDWQNGSKNPTLLSTPQCLFTEMHKVSAVPSGTKVEIPSVVVFPNYNLSTVGQAHPVDGVTTSRLRKVTPVEFSGFNGFRIHNNDTNFRGIIGRHTVNCYIKDCQFSADGGAGRHVIIEQSAGFEFIGNYENRRAVGSTGSSWNSFIFGGGTQSLYVLKNKINGGVQSVDVSAGLSSSFPIADSDLLCDSLASHGISFSKNFCNGAGEPFTTHPGTYDLVASGNVILGAGNGLRVRSRKNVITGNLINTKRTGMSFSSFYEDTLVSGNEIGKLFNDSLSWSGIEVTPSSSEVMNQNNIKSLSIIGNSISASDSNSSNAAVFFRHVGNGVMPNPSFDLFTSDVKTSLSQYAINSNIFRGCGVVVNRYVNGVTVSDNDFHGMTKGEFFIKSLSPTARINFIENRLHGSAGISLSDSSGETYSYTTGNVVSGNAALNGSVELVNANPVLRESVGDDMSQAVIPLPDKGRVEAVRAAGPCTLNIDVLALDGVSQGNVRVNYLTPTADARFSVKGTHIAEGVTWFYPDNTHPLGSATFRSSVVYSGTGAINTSDAREKTTAVQIPDEVLDAWGDISFISFQWLRSVSEKGFLARWHFGVIAQQVRDAFEGRGIDGTKYGLLCYDQWSETPEEVDKETGEVIQERIPAGDRWGIRPDQCLFLEAAYQRRRATCIEIRVSEIERSLALL